MFTFAVIGYLTNPDPNKSIKWEMKLWKWCLLVMAINEAGMGLIIWDMMSHRVDGSNKVFDDVTWKIYAGNILINGPGLMIFYTGMTLLGLIAPEDIRGLMFSMNGLIGGLLVTASNILGSLTLDYNELITWQSAFGIVFIFMMIYIILGASGKLKI